jgi:hypothetical protein
VSQTLSDDTKTVSVQQSDLLTDRDIALRTGMSFIKVRRLMKQGDIPGQKMGQSWMVPRPLWEQYLNGEWERAS